MWHPDQKSSETDAYHYKYSQRILQWERQLRSVVWFSLCLLMKNHVCNRTWVHFFWTQMQGNGKSRCQVVYKLLHHSNLLMTAGSQGSHGGSPIGNHSLPPAFIWIHLGFSHRVPVCVLCLIYVFGFALQPQFTLESLCAYDTSFNCMNMGTTFFHGVFTFFSAQDILYLGEKSIKLAQQRRGRMENKYNSTSCLGWLWEIQVNWILCLLLPPIF